MSSENSLPYMTQFDGKRYYAWRKKAVGYLTIKGVWKTVCAVESRNKKQSEIEQDEKEARALAYLQSVIKDDILDLFNQDSANALWKALEDRYQAQDVVNKTLLQNKLRTLSLQEGGNLEEYIKSLKSIFTELSGAGKVYSELEQGQQFLTGLPDSYFPFIMSLSSLPAEKLTFEWIERSLLSIQTFRAENSNKQMEQSRILMSKGGQNVNQRRDKKPGRCHNCGKRGHWARECRTKRQGNNTGENQGKAYLTSTEGLLLNLSKASQPDKDRWFIDGGASFSVT